MPDVDSKKPKIVDIKRKPRITELRGDLQPVKTEDDALNELVDSLPSDTARDELRKKQLEDITPTNPEEELLKKKKKRFKLF